MAAFRKDFDMDLLKLILPPGVLGIVIGALLFKGLDAHPLKLTATMVFFLSVVNLCEWIPCAWLGLPDLRNMATSLVLLPPIGVRIGVRRARRIS